MYFAFPFVCIFYLMKLFQQHLRRVQCLKLYGTIEKVVLRHTTVGRRLDQVRHLKQPAFFVGPQCFCRLLQMPFPIAHIGTAGQIYPAPASADLHRQRRERQCDRRFRLAYLQCDPPDQRKLQQHRFRRLLRHRLDQLIRMLLHKPVKEPAYLPIIRGQRQIIQQSRTSCIRLQHDIEIEILSFLILLPVNTMMRIYL